MSFIPHQINVCEICFIFCYTIGIVQRNRTEIKIKYNENSKRYKYAHWYGDIVYVTWCWYKRKYLATLWHANQVKLPILILLWFKKKCNVLWGQQDKLFHEKRYEETSACCIKNIWCVWLNMECVPFQKLKEDHIIFCYNFVHESVLTNDYFNSQPYKA